MVLAVLERGHLLLVDQARRQEALAGVWAIFLEWILSNFNVLQVRWGCVVLRETSGKD